MSGKSRRRKCSVCGELIAARGMRMHLKKHSVEIAKGRRFPQTLTLDQDAAPATPSSFSDDRESTAEEKELVDKVITLEHKVGVLRRMVRQYQTVLGDLTELLDTSLQDRE